MWVEPRSSCRCTGCRRVAGGVQGSELRSSLARPWTPPATRRPSANIAARRDVSCSRTRRRGSGNRDRRLCNGASSEVFLVRNLEVPRRALPLQLPRPLCHRRLISPSPSPANSRQDGISTHANVKRATIAASSPWPDSVSPQAIDGGGAIAHNPQGFMAHLLLVDDDNDIVEALGDLLREEGHEVHSAATGEEGLIVLRGSPLPDVLVLDVDMPVLGGPGMAHKMLLHDAGEENVPIILMSARGDLPQVARQMGTSYVLRKPTTINTFLDLLNRALRERQAPTSA